MTAPEELLNRLRKLSMKELVSVAARFRIAGGPSEVPAATKFALRSVARRYQALSREIADLEAHLDRLVAQVAPELVALAGIGTDSAATPLIVAGDNPQRLGSEASFANLCGVAPIEASSGKVAFGTISTAVATGRPEQCAVHDLSGPDETRSSHQGVRREANRWRSLARASARSSAASSATSRGRSTAC